MASIDRHNIEIRREFSDLSPFPIDKQKFLQVVVNLISNAKNAVLESNSRERLIAVRLSAIEGDGARVEVTDTGVGISPEHLTRLFSHGFTTRKKGHGFGLHSARHLAGAMGGTLTARSSGAGQGATFIFEIPGDRIPVSNE
jgi:signal transduction histidine kinase